MSNNRRQLKMSIGSWNEDLGLSTPNHGLVLSTSMEWKCKSSQNLVFDKIQYCIKYTIPPEDMTFDCAICVVQAVG